MTNPELSNSDKEAIILPRNIDIDQLLEKLIAAKIPIDKYGVGPAKTVYDLLSEINEGESILTIDENENIHRQVNVLWLDVFCNLSNSNTYKLKEDHQEYKDGRIKVRNLDFSLGEKIKPDETVQEAISRALQEEIGVKTVESLNEIGYIERIFIPDTFPGIESTYKMHEYTSVIPESAFAPEGYIEIQDDKTNYYIWELIKK